MFGHVVVIAFVNAKHARTRAWICIQLTSQSVWHTQLWYNTTETCNGPLSSVLVCPHVLQEILIYYMLLSLFIRARISY